jgi:hypothetical protein
VERALYLDLVGHRGIDRRRIDRLASGHFGLETGDLDGERADRGFAAAELGAGGGAVELDQLLAGLDLLADAHPDRLDDSALEVGDGLELRSRGDSPHAADGRSSSVTAAQMTKITKKPRITQSITFDAVRGLIRSA